MWGFYFMTVNEILKQSGLKYRGVDAIRLGIMFMSKAKKAKVRSEKKDEVIQVNDFPESIVPDLQEIVIQYFSSLKKDKK